MSEFPVALAIFVPVMLGLVSLSTFLLGIGSTQLACELAVRKAAQTMTLSQAKIEVGKYNDQFLKKFFAALVLKRDINTPLLALTVVKKNSKAEPPIYRVSAKYQLRPFLFSSGLAMQTEACAIAEHPEGL